MKTIKTRIGDHKGPQLWQQFVVFLLSCAIVVTRRPDALFHAQFWAEDGHVWFAEAYNLGWLTALCHPWAGYLQTFSRLGASLALLAPFSFAPLTLNLIAIAAQALPVNLLLSSRSSGWGSLRFRALCAGLYLALPNCGEISTGITNSLWVLALCAFLLLVASKPTGAIGRAFDIVVILLCGLTGPYCIFLLPIAVFLALKRRDAWRRVVAILLAGAGVIQVCELVIAGPTGRLHPPLGANLWQLIRILAGQIYLGTLLGGNGLSHYSGTGFSILFVSAAVLGSLIVAFCFFNSSQEMKLFILFCGMVLAASLIYPMCNPPAGVSAWESLSESPNVRYWFFPMLAFAWSLLWCSRSRHRILRYGSIALLILTCVGIARDWRHPAFQDLHFAEYAKRFEAAAPGTTMTIPENPETWYLTLVKHPKGQ